MGITITPYRKTIKICTIDYDEVIELHNLLSTDKVLLEETEPVYPPGLKNSDTLHSAVGRQLTSLGEIYKYDNLYTNCATLLYGVIKGHSFHNGNKRSGFMAMLKHLYANGLVLKSSLDKDVLFEFIRCIAANELRSFAKKQKKNCVTMIGTLEKKHDIWDEDAKIDFISLWLQQNSRSKRNNYKPLKWEEVWDIFRKFNVDVRIDDSKQIAYLTRISPKPILWGFKLKTEIQERFKFSGEYCDKKDIVTLRKLTQLSKSNGIDDEDFYNDHLNFSHEIAFYKSLIRKLALT